MAQSAHHQSERMDSPRKEERFLPKKIMSCAAVRRKKNAPIFGTTAPSIEG
jgi:hypothetical protein